jgi:1-acyl-sn-glycerol-3-phosphate acyltransferase
MRRAFRLTSILFVSLLLAAILDATAWTVPEPRRGRYRTVFRRAWSRTICAILRIHVDVIGDLPDPGEEWLAVSNHLGYADIPVLGSILPVAFVSKAEVARWPLVGSLATLGGTLYVDRKDRRSASLFAERISARLSSGDRILVFPEGTSTRGDVILPFKSVPFAAVAGSPGRSVLPVHIEVVEIEGKAAVGPGRDAACWHGETDFIPHLFRFVDLRDIRYRVVIGLPIPAGECDRKTLARMSRDRIEGLEKVSERRGRMLPGNFIWVRSVS